MLPEGRRHALFILVPGPWPGLLQKTSLISGLKYPPSPPRTSQDLPGALFTEIPGSSQNPQIWPPSPPRSSQVLPGSWPGPPRSSQVLARSSQVLLPGPPRSSQVLPRSSQILPDPGPPPRSSQVLPSLPDPARSSQILPNISSRSFCQIFPPRSLYISNPR